jgi:hypothetical protein
MTFILKLTELIIKILIALCFIASMLVFIFFYAMLDFNIDYLKIKECADIGIGGWNREEKLCNLGFK